MSGNINLDALYVALSRDGAFSWLSQIDQAALQLMPEKGLAHDHVRIVGTGLILRVPRQSQFAFAAADNLAYQSACFERASQGAHAPRLHGVLPPSQDVPMGALVVDEIEGRTVELPADLAALAECLASIHRLDLPLPEDRTPLAYHRDPIAGTLAFINEQARFLDDATDDADAISLIKKELRWAASLPTKTQKNYSPLPSLRATHILETMWWTKQDVPISSILKRRFMALPRSIWRIAHFIRRPPGILPRATSSIQMM